MNVTMKGETALEYTIDDQEYELRVAIQLNNIGSQLIQKKKYEHALETFNKTNSALSMAVSLQDDSLFHAASCVWKDERVLTAQTALELQTDQVVTDHFVPWDDKQIDEHMTRKDVKIIPPLMWCIDPFFIGTDLAFSHNTSSLKKKQVLWEVSVVAVYNSALSHHLLHNMKGNDDHLHKSLDLYKLVCSMTTVSKLEGNTGIDSSIRDLLMSTLNNMGKIYHELQEFKTGSDAFKQALEHGTNITSMHAEDNSLKLIQNEEKKKEKKLMLLSCPSFCNEWCGTDISIRTLILSNMCIMMFHEEKFDMATKMCAHMIQMSDALIMNEILLATSELVTYRNGADRLKGQQFLKALECLQLALQLRMQRKNQPTPAFDRHTGNLLHLIGKIQLKLERLPEAMYYLQKAYQVMKSAHDSNHSDVAQPLLSIGKLYYKRGESVLALCACKKALKHLSFAVDSGKKVKPLLLQGKIYDNQGKLDNAIQAYHSSLQIIRKCDSIEMKPALVSALNALCTLHREKGELDQAQEYLDELHRISNNKTFLFGPFQYHRAAAA